MYYYYKHYYYILFSGIIKSVIMLTVRQEAVSCSAKDLVPSMAICSTPGSLSQQAFGVYTAESELKDGDIHRFSSKSHSKPRLLVLVGHA